MPKTRGSYSQNIPRLVSMGAYMHFRMCPDRWQFIDLRERTRPMAKTSECLFSQETLLGII